LICFRFTDEVSVLFGPILACNYLFHLVCCSLLLLECGYSAMLRYGPMTVLIYGQLIQMSVIFELLGSEVSKIFKKIQFPQRWCQ
ncbi:uncharacterized protein LOC114350256, partial [Ostrinia furnacalis]|uniref:uncharacterized protein LOC114350256 n=1 Tax=Ostrinia furnacalis TaxID=93504 RepID=UPI00103BCBD6